MTDTDFSFLRKEDLQLILDLQEVDCFILKILSADFMQAESKFTCEVECGKMERIAYIYVRADETGIPSASIHVV